MSVAFQGVSTMSNVYCFKCKHMIVTASKVADYDEVSCPFCGRKAVALVVGCTGRVGNRMMFEGEFIL